MQDILTPLNILLGIIALFGIAFTIFLYFKNPQNEVETKAQLLAQQLNWEKEATAQRFKDTNENVSTTLTLAQNHIHSISVQVENLDSRVGELKNEVVRIGTILEERLPHSKK